MIFFRLTGIRHAIGFEIYEGYYLYKKCQQPPANEVDRLKQLLKPLGLNACDRELEFHIRPEDRYVASDLFRRCSIKEEQLKVVIHPGGKKPSKLWPKSNFALLIDKLIENIGGQIILVGSTDEIEMVKEIIELINHKVVNLTGKLNLFQLAGIIDKADLVIGNDSGPMHIAAAVKTPVVALFSGVNIPHLWYPYGSIHTVIRKDVSCSPCFKSACSDHYCMNGINVEEVFHAVKRTLDQREASRG